MFCDAVHIYINKYINNEKRKGEGSKIQNFQAYNQFISAHTRAY